MSEALRFENEQLKRKLLQTQEERDRAMSNCHELWKRLNSLISLAASTTANYGLSSGLPTSPSDSYDSRSKSTSPNSSADSLNGASAFSSSSGSSTISSNPPHAHAAPLNLKSLNSIKFGPHNFPKAPAGLGAPAAGNAAHQQQADLNNNSASGAGNNGASAANAAKSAGHLNKSDLKADLKLDLNNNNNNNSHAGAGNISSSNNPLGLGPNATPLNLKSVNAIKDINNNHPLIAEVAKVTTVGEIEEIAPGQFKCRYCEKTFDRIFSVHRHERVHTGFKPCVCKACGRGFSEKRNLRHHIIRFHSDGTGRELLKRNRNKSAAQEKAKQQIKQLSAAASFLQQQQQQHHHHHHNQHHHHLHHHHQQQPHNQQQHHSSASAAAAAATTTSSSTTNQLHESSRLIQQQQHSQQQISNQHNNNNKYQEPLDTSGLSALAAVITVSSSSSSTSSASSSLSSSSRRRKSKPSKKINY